MKKDIDSIVIDMVNEMEKIRAFGNSNVKMEVARSAEKIIEVITKMIEAIEKTTQLKLQETANQYASAGTVSEEILSGISIKNTGNNPEQK